MKVTPDIIRAEFIGARSKIVRSRHSDYVGLTGQLIDETRNTFTILCDDRRKTVIKESSVFDFTLVDGTTVEIAGQLLVGRPEDRLRKTVRRLW